MRTQDIPDVAHIRLINQRIAARHLSTPEDVVSWLGAVQAQDYPGARWALGLRMKGSTDDAVARAYDEGRILRTHLLRPTWHFVAKDDIRWILALSAPQVRKIISSYGRQLGLDEATHVRANDLITRALQGEKYLTRTELMVILSRAGIPDATGVRAACLMMRAEQDAVVCSGPMLGKKSTYALLDERVPRTSVVAREDALVALATRYFTSHGPATLDDFVWWSGLSQKDARTGQSRMHPTLRPEVVDGRVHWFPRPQKFSSSDIARAFLLPVYDEYGIGYTDRSAIFDASRLTRPAGVKQPSFWSMIVIGGRMVGTWRRTIKKHAVLIEAGAIGRFNDAEKRAIAMAAEEYGAFLGVPVTLTV